MTSYRRSRSSGALEHQDALDFSHQVFKGGKAEASSSTVNSYCKTLQMVYHMDTKQQLGKPKCDTIIAVSNPYLKEFEYYHRCRNPISPLFTGPELCPFVCPSDHKADLTTKFSIVLGNKDKSTCSVTDLFHLLDIVGAKMPIVPYMGAIASRLHC